LSLDLREKDTTGKLSVVVPSLQKIVIETPSLEYLKFGDHNAYDHYCLIENMPNLIEAYIEVALPNINSLIESITHVKRLTICSEAMYDGSFVFIQLEHLELCTCNTIAPDLLVRLLKESSNLQVLDVSMMEVSLFVKQLFVLSDAQNGFSPNSCNQPSPVPECMLSSLQTFKWLDYTGEPTERDLVVYILQNAVHLKTTRITLNECHVPKSEMIKELARSSRASTKCQLIFD
ncbi:hypothetical protein AALP_AA5G194400, partial [Arabis alpina]